MPKFKVGDKVIINKQATIEDFTKDFWGGCQLSTLQFIKYYADKNRIFTIIRIFEDTLILEEYEGLLNPTIFELAEKEQVRKMTVNEICKELGYEIEIIKEEK